MKTTCITSLTILLLSVSCNLFSQKIIKRDARIAEAVSLVDKNNLKSTITDLVQFHTRHNMSSLDNDSVGIGAAVKYLESRLEEIAKNKEDYFSIDKTDYGRLTNITATIKGTDKPDQYILLLAHYDSRTADIKDSTSFAPGANDNGSGVAALMQIAEIISWNPLPVSVKVMFLSGEEHGLLGAKHMAKLAKINNWNILAVLNNDMISNSESSYTYLRNNMKLRVFSENVPYVESPEEAKERHYNSSHNDSPSRQLARYIKETGERYVDNLEIKLIYRNDRFGRGGDHTPFSQKGFTSVRICEYYENYDRTHKVTETVNGRNYKDIISGVDHDYLRKNTMVNLSVVMNMAYAPSPPENVFTDVSELSNYSTISWDQPDQKDAPYGYYLLLRETDSATWQKKIFVKTNKITVPYSKDNFFFAVQSVNETGNESIAVFSKGKR
jgi:Zn-dependent M28 family amino/carboxypeptidase